MEAEDKAEKLRESLKEITSAFSDYSLFRDDEDYEELVKAMNNGLKVLKETE
jgi:hypothetical protein